LIANINLVDIFHDMSSTLTPDRLTAVDLTALPNENMAELRREAIRRGISMADLVAALIADASARLVANRPSAGPTVADIIHNSVPVHLRTEGQN
jgi:hypothetical protein